MQRKIRHIRGKSETAEDGSQKWERVGECGLDVVLLIVFEMKLFINSVNSIYYYVVQHQTVVFCSLSWCSSVCQLKHNMVDLN